MKKQQKDKLIDMGGTRGKRLCTKEGAWKAENPSHSTRKGWSFCTGIASGRVLNCTVLLLWI